MNTSTDRLATRIVRPLLAIELLLVAFYSRISAAIRRCLIRSSISTAKPTSLRGFHLRNC